MKKDGSYEERDLRLGMMFQLEDHGQCIFLRKSGKTTSMIEFEDGNQQPYPTYKILDSINQRVETR